MAEASDIREKLYQNLVDAGCCQEMVAQCMDLICERRTAELTALLSRHRAALLEAVHENQRRIDCLDFLIHHLGKRE